MRLFLPPQASLKLHCGQTSETSWNILDHLELSNIVQSTFSVFTLFSPEAHIRYQCWVGKSSEGPRELEAQNAWADVLRLEPRRVETCRNSPRRTPGDNLSVDMYLTDWEERRHSLR